MARGVTWYEHRIRQFTDVAPVQAHRIATAEAAGIAAKLVRSKATGTLARDVSRPLYVGTMRAFIGSSLRYAAMENWGGVIRAKGSGRMLIHGNRPGTRSTVGGEVTASAREVRHRGKHFLEAAVAAYPGRYLYHLRRLMPR